ncbi:MAG: hypothetical protein U9R37_05720 [Campylobacterota bacterium]|nr:hypothetical protein [Campylobacterota bacterium]
MDLEELKKRRNAKILEHKRKKRAYYLKAKMQKKQSEPKKIVPVDYEVELFSGNFAQKLKEIAKKQKLHIESRESIINKKVQEYKNKKQDYYAEHKESRLEYDKEYREKKKEELKEYRKEYYRKNKEKILAQQKANRLKQKMEK